MLSNYKSQVMGFDTDSIRYQILNSIRIYNKQFRDEFGEMILCFDGSNSWRKQKFKYYKFKRKEDQSKDKIPWEILWKNFEIVYKELIKFSPYIIMRVEEAEADDVIAVISRNFNEKHVIVSSDRDFLQLQKYQNIQQYSPKSKEFLICDDVEKCLYEHIQKGDRNDGIPNIASSDDVFFIGERQKTSSKKHIDYVLNGVESNLTDEMKKIVKRNFQRNRMLIDFDFIPYDIEKKIMNEFKNHKYNALKARTKFLFYLHLYRMKNLYSKYHDFIRSHRYDEKYSRNYC